MRYRWVAVAVMLTLAGSSPGPAAAQPKPIEPSSRAGSAPFTATTPA